MSERPENKSEKQTNVVFKLMEVIKVLIGRIEGQIKSIEVSSFIYF